LKGRYAQVYGEMEGREKMEPFCSEKLFANIYRWREIRRGERLPPPVFITVDPTNYATSIAYGAIQILEGFKQTSLSHHTIVQLSDFIPKWKERNWGVEAVVIAGGGEPLLNQSTGELIDRLICSGIHVGLITNGTRIDNSWNPSQSVHGSLYL